MRYKLQLITLVLLSAFSFPAFAQNTEDDAFAEIKKHREKQEEEFRDKEKSPLPVKEIRKFKGLNYYPADLRFRVKAKFVKNETPVLFKMKTSTTRLPEYSKYGELLFTINGIDYKLEVYQSPEISGMPEHKDYLFVPFTDETNGKGSYQGGRYIDLKSPLGDEVILDFNQCYNPYCSYSPNFSCPIPPAVNHIPMEIQAGEKSYKH
jgi:uncharacterized protein (DUF1684 family)